MYKQKIKKKLNQKGGGQLVQCAFYFKKEFNGENGAFARFFKYFATTVYSTPATFALNNISSECRINNMNEFFSRDTVYIILDQTTNAMLIMLNNFITSNTLSKKIVKEFLYFFYKANLYMFNKLTSAEGIYDDGFFIKFTGNQLLTLCQTVESYKTDYINYDVYGSHIEQPGTGTQLETSRPTSLEKKPLQNMQANSIRSDSNNLYKASSNPSSVQLTQVGVIGANRGPSVSNPSNSFTFGLPHFFNTEKVNAPISNMPAYISQFQNSNSPSQVISKKTHNIDSAPEFSPGLDISGSTSNTMPISESKKEKTTTLIKPQEEKTPVDLSMTSQDDPWKHFKTQNKELGDNQTPLFVNQSNKSESTGESFIKGLDVKPFGRSPASARNIEPGKPESKLKNTIKEEKEEEEDDPWATPLNVELPQGIITNTSGVIGNSAPVLKDNITLKNGEVFYFFRKNGSFVGNPLEKTKETFEIPPQKFWNEELKKKIKPNGGDYSKRDKQELREYWWKYINSDNSANSKYQRSISGGGKIIKKKVPIVKKSKTKKSSKKSSKKVSSTIKSKTKKSSKKNTKKKSKILKGGSKKKSKVLKLSKKTKKSTKKSSKISTKKSSKKI